MIGDDTPERLRASDEIHPLSSLAPGHPQRSEKPLPSRQRTGRRGITHGIERTSNRQESVNRIALQACHITTYGWAGGPGEFHDP